MLTNIPLIGLALTAGAVLLLRDWRVSVPTLLLNYLFLALFLAQQQFIEPDLQLLGRLISTTVVVKLVTGIAVVLILAVTALTFSRDYNLEDLDEFGLAELRRAARRAQRLRSNQPFQFSDYVIPFWSLLLALLASLTLPRLYPIAPSPQIDFAWYMLAFTGLLTLATANDMLKVGLGLLLCTSSIDLLYTALATGVGVIPLALISLVTILLALMVAYLSGLLYGRLKTLDLGELYRQ
jgi:hypothetical protein